MVRDPSIVSPSLTGVFIGWGHNKHGTGVLFVKFFSSAPTKNYVIWASLPSIREDTLERTRIRLESSRASTRKSYAVPDIHPLACWGHATKRTNKTTLSQLSLSHNSLSKRRWVGTRSAWTTTGTEASLNAPWPGRVAERDRTTDQREGGANHAESPQNDPPHSRRGWVGKAKNRRSQSAGAVAEPGAATERHGAGPGRAARELQEHHDVRRVLSVHGEKSVKTGRRDEVPSYEKTLLSEYLR